jgi:3-keto-disaccharide hydrolase
MKETRIMKTTILVCGILCLAFAAHAAPPEGDGWVSLFNGKDLSGWKVSEEASKVWKITDGVIDCNPRSDIKGDRSLWSEKKYGDFTLHVEWRLKETKGEYAMLIVQPDGSNKTDAKGLFITEKRPNADSGVYVRGTSKAQINIWCWPIGSGEVWGYRMDKKMPPEVRAGATPKVCADKPVGEWNTFVITMKGDKLTVVLNGKTVLDKAQLPDVPKDGPLALQHHGGYDAKKDTWSPASSLIQFRNIYVKENK